MQTEVVTEHLIVGQKLMGGVDEPFVEALCGHRGLWDLFLVRADVW